MKIYQSVLPAATRRCSEAESTTDHDLARRMKSHLTRIFANGFWYCNDCETRCERVEGENGQPSHCDQCQSPRIDYVPPAWAESTDLAPQEKEAA